MSSSETNTGPTEVQTTATGVRLHPRKPDPTARRSRRTWPSGPATPTELAPWVRSASSSGSGSKLALPTHQEETTVNTIDNHFIEADSRLIVPLAVLFLIGGPSIALADTTEVKGPAPVIVAKSGKHCKDDPHCFNRIHSAIKPVAHVKPGQQFVLETRDGLDSDLTFDSTPQDVAAINLNLCHPLTGPVYIEGTKRGDAIAVTVVDIAPDDFGTTTIVPGFGFLRDSFPLLTSSTGS